MPDEIGLCASSAVFSSFGRTLLCLDRDFRVIHGAPPGTPIAEILGDELFGEAGAMRAALERGERREGWCATMASRQVSVTAAPFSGADGVAYIVELRPFEEDPYAGTAAPIAFFGMVARSAAMRRIFTLVRRLQTSEAPLLITGERGTGKEVLARAVHANSPRSHEPFGSLQAFSASGTLFVDEVGELPLQLQAELLRALQETNARVIAATSTDLRRAIAESRFREDLFAHLRTVSIEIPPLRSRRDDIEPIAQCLLARAGARSGRRLRLAPDAIRALLRHKWPGNVRELENAMAHAAAVADGETIRAGDLPAELTATTAEASPAPRGESHAIRAALEAHRWNRETTARALGISRTTLWRKMRELGLN